MKKKNRKILILVVIAALAAAGGFSAGRLMNSGASADSSLHTAAYSFNYDWVRNGQLVAHALGGIDDKTYTNSEEALVLNYERGFRVFEADFQLTKEGQLVLCHDWSQYRSIAGAPESGEPMTYEEYKSQVIMGRYTPLTCEALMDLMSEYPDMYLITDTKDSNEIVVKAQMSQLVWHAGKKDPKILDRIIIQLYSEEMLKYVMDVYPFSSVLITLYQFGHTDEEVIDYCLSNNIKVVTIPESRMTPGFVSRLNEAGLCSFIHTINDTGRAGELLGTGVSGIYTDFISIEDLRG